MLELQLFDQTIWHTSQFQERKIPLMLSKARNNVSFYSKNLSPFSRNETTVNLLSLPFDINAANGIIEILMVVRALQCSESRNELVDERTKNCLRAAASHTIQILRTCWRRNSVNLIVVLLSFKMKP